MATTNTFYQVGINNQQSKPSIQYIVNKAPVLAVTPMEETTHGWSDIAVVDTSVDALVQVDLDAPVTDLTTTEKIVETKVAAFSGRVTVPMDTAKLYSSAGVYFSKRAPKHFEKTGADIEASIIAALRAYAITNGNKINALGEASTNYSMIAVTWEMNEITGIYNPESFGQGGFIDVQYPYGGELSEIYRVDSKPVFGYQMLLKTNFGIKLLNPNYVGVIANIDKVNKRSSFTYSMINDLLVNVRQNNATMIICRPELLPLLQDMKMGRLELVNSDMGINTRVYDWNGTMIVPTYNMSAGAEAAVSFS